MDEFISQMQYAVAAVQKNWLFALSWIGLLFLIFICNLILKRRLNYLGLLPRSLPGLIGIFTSPFLHADFNHLFFNAIPLFVLINFMLIVHPAIFYHISIFIILLSGALVWIFGRKGIHLGASGLITGYWSFLMVQAFSQGTFLAIGLAVICIYYFGGIFLGIFPMKTRQSWEGHLAGFIAGLVAAFLVSSR